MWSHCTELEHCKTYRFNCVPLSSHVFMFPPQTECFFNFVVLTLRFSDHGLFISDQILQQNGFYYCT